MLGGVGRAGRRTLHSVRLFGAARLSASGRPAEQLLLMPQDLRTADPSFATEIYYGQFGLAGRIAQTGSTSPFAIVPPSEEWARELHGFGWLRHLRAAGDQISREHARALTREWLRANSASRGLPWEPDIVARRTISWLAHAALLIEGADAAFYDAFMAGLARQVRYVSATYADAPDGVPRLLTLTSLLQFGLCVAEQQSYLDRFSRPLSDELERQIYADGGHISRDPLDLVEALLDLLPLRHCFSARDRIAPKALTDAIDRMMPMLRFFRLGDGGLARFNGVGATPTDALATVLACDDAHGRPISHATDSGYCRLERGDTVVVADVGKPPARALGGRAHAGCLSFELSSGNGLLIVNCGAPTSLEEDWRLVCRATAAHSALVVDDTSSARFAGGKQVTDAPLAGLGEVTAALTHDGEAIELAASHDGYASAFGLIHSRRINLAPNGAKVIGEDRLSRSRRGGTQGVNRRFAIRFHLHPAVAAELQSDGRSVMLLLPNEDVWRMTASGGEVSVEDSAYLGDPRGPRRGRQIVVQGTVDQDGARVDWTFEQRSSSLMQRLEEIDDEDVGEPLERDEDEADEPLQPDDAEADEESEERQALRDPEPSEHPDEPLGPDEDDAAGEIAAGEDAEPSAYSDAGPEPTRSQDETEPADDPDEDGEAEQGTEAPREDDESDADVFEEDNLEDPEELEPKPRRPRRDD